MVSRLRIAAERFVRKPAFALVPALTFVAGAGVAGALALDRPSGDASLQRSDPDRGRGVEVVLGEVPGAKPVPSPQPPVVAVAEYPDQQSAVPTDVGSTEQESVSPDLAHVIQSLSPPDQIDQNLQRALIDLDDKADRDETIRQQQALEHLSPAEGLGPPTSELPVEHVAGEVTPALPGPEQTPPAPMPQP